MRIAPEVTPFVRAGFRAREFFPHEVVWLSKPYPDAYLNLERRGVTRADVLAGDFVQLNLYSDHLEGLPDALFTDPAVNWHGQQFGKRGLIAAAGLFIRHSAACVTLLQSDLCQQVYRQPELKRAAAAKLNNRFRYWYLLLVNAVLDFAAATKLDTVFSPTAAHIVASTQKQITPALFEQIYDAVSTRYACAPERVGAADYWKIPIADNHDRIVPLEEAMPPVAPRTSKVICIVHDTEEDIDTSVSPRACKDALARMLAIERTLDVRTTYSILGRLFPEKAPLIAMQDAHALAFHSFDHDIGNLTQLARVREVDLQIKGYRPPQSSITPELTDYALGHANFEWLVSSAHSLGFAEPRLENGLVKIPMHTDDYSLHTGEHSWESWIARVVDDAQSHDVVTIGLHDCYAPLWIERYATLLELLGSLGEFWTCEQVVDRVRFDTALASPHSAVGTRTSRCS